MYLRSLKVVGFKSFADRTRLEFEPGVTIVVGPNGSGKSNLVDAVSWAMGTQAPSNLRTQRMEDAIFAGTATRSALGRAEVSLTFDNASGLLPLDLPEVTVTRRLYRDGTSEYEINGAGCRLIDIQDLLADSGVGRHQHVVVGQGRLDAVLNAGPEEHRGIIEEAAGVLKHRLRKERAIRRLERTDEDVLRLHDILRELKRRMRPLRRQAEAAGRYEEIRAEARALRLFLGGEELRRTRARLAELGGEQQRLLTVREEAETEIGELEGSLGELEEQAGEAGRALDRDTSAAARLETTAERLRRIAQVARERNRTVVARLEGAGERRRDLAEEAGRLEAELAKSAEEERRTRLGAESREAELRTLEEEERSLAEQEALSPEGAVAMLRGDLRSLEASADRDDRETEAVGRRLEVVRALVADESAEVDRLSRDVEILDSLVGQAQGAYEAAREERRSTQEAWDRAQQEARRAETVLAEARARVAALEEASRGWTDPETRRRLAEEEPSVRGPVAELLDVPSELLPAVEAALGGWADGFVTRDRAGAAEVVRSLKSSARGGVSVIGLEPGSPLVPARAVAGEWGLEALVDRLGGSADPALAALLLGDVVLVEGWSTAWGVVERHPDIRAVTPEGDLVTGWGVRVADPGETSPVVLESARVEEEAAAVAAARAASRVTTTHRDFEAVRNRERATLECLELLEARLAGVTEALDRLERSRAAAEEEIGRLEERSRALSGQAAERRIRMEELRGRLASLEGEEAVRQQAWDDLARRRTELGERREAARRAREEAASSLAATLERRRMLERRLQEVRRELQDLIDRPADPGVVARLELVEDRARRALEIVRSHLEALRERQRDLRRQAGEAGERLGAARVRLEAARERAAESRERLSGLAVEQAELGVREESAAEALRRDVDASEEEALTADRPELSDGADLRERLETVEAELRRMGPVNPLAAAEYRELEEEAGFLEAQLADLEESRRELRKVIRSLDDEMIRLFVEAFEDVARHFEESFGVLFPGGKGRLLLTDPEDPVGTGVEIRAQPLGKRVSRLSLLSGGERALVSLAFLFAVFKARPSPFYILDEVDAALDDANLRRFLRLIDQLRGTAQLVVVTHQQQTMEAADVLYGVTMEPGGSSRVVAKRLSEVPISA